MKIMISQPMRFKTEEQIREQRKDLVEYLENQGYEVVDSILDLGEGKEPLHYLVKSLEILADVGGLVCMPRLERSKRLQDRRAVC